jgi:tetraacyldisaccharide 4'-kinase
VRATGRYRRSSLICCSFAFIIANRMRAPAFWWRKAGAAATVAQPLAAIYGAVAAWRLKQPGADAGVPVLCIGDPTLGGGGKTPTALAAARLLAGERPFFLTRGYGGRLAGPLRVEPGVHVANDVGDEPLLLGRAYPTIVARDRIAGARLARAGGAGMIVMDDGFQNPTLAKNCALLVVDAARGVGNGLGFPAGPLRAPLLAQIGRAHAIMVIGTGGGADPVLEAASRRNVAIFRGSLAPSSEVLSGLLGRPVLAFAGIGHPDKFYATLTAAGVEVRARRAFADHHAYTARDAASLLREANAQGLTLVTTEKDFVRFESDQAGDELRRRAVPLPVRLAVEEEAVFAAFLQNRIRARA